MIISHVFLPCVVWKKKWERVAPVIVFHPTKRHFYKTTNFSQTGLFFRKRKTYVLFIRRNRLYERNALTKGQYLYLLTLPKRFHKSISQNFIKILLYVILQDIFIPRSIPPGSNFIHLLFLLC